MNARLEEITEKSKHNGILDTERFAHNIIRDILSILTNDDKLGMARVNTIKQIVELYELPRFK